MRRLFFVSVPIFRAYRRSAFPLYYIYLFGTRDRRNGNIRPKYLAQDFGWIDEMSRSKTRIPCGWHQRKQARRRGTNVKEEARFYVEWIDPAARSTLTAAHSACSRPPRGILRLYRDVITYAAAATVNW